jgi:predicted nucleic acid-binding protein
VIVISDTSPLHYLVMIGHIEVLPKLYGQVICPPEVVAECLHPHTPAPVRVWASLLPTWLQVEACSTWTDPRLQKLDPGEAAALRLAHDKQADLVLMDERRGRETATDLGFKVAGVVAVLADAASNGLLDFDAAVVALCQTTNFRISPKVIAAVRAKMP